MQCFSHLLHGISFRKKNSRFVKSSIKIVVLGIVLLGFGALRFPFEVKLSKDLRVGGLTPAPLEIDTRDKIDQTSSAVVLGGLRTLVATFLNLRAFSYFQEQKWDDVAESFRTIVDLAPRTRYYWETGAWHSAYNAASYYYNDSKLAPLRRREAWRMSIVRGRAFLERGIRNNPDDWRLHSYLGFMLADANKFPAFQDPNATFAASADAYGKAVATGKAMDFTRRAQLYSLARVKGREAEALALVRSLYATRGNQTPTIKTLLFILEAYQNPQMEMEKRATEIFETPEKAYSALCNQWVRTRELYPVYGIAEALGGLEVTLKKDPNESIFKQPLQSPTMTDDWFTK